MDILWQSNFLQYWKEILFGKVARANSLDFRKTFFCTDRALNWSKNIYTEFLFLEADLSEIIVASNLIEILTQ